MDKNFFNSSDEPLPLSQETSNYLWDIINEDGSGQSLNNVSEVKPAQSTVQSACSSLPAITDWPGDYGFNVRFAPQDFKNANKLSWIFSESERWLFVKKDAPCPISFSTDFLLLPGASVRAMAVYTAPNHASESVRRCIRHTMEEEDSEKFEADHLIRSECSGAYYMQTENKHRSVVVPFENPPAGQCFSTYIYKFVCFSSCGGGPSRRPLTLVFTLEQNGAVLGRRTLNLRICACPARDSGTIPKTPQPQTCPKKAKVETKMEKQVSVPKKKLEENKKYIIQTSDLECWQFLQSMKEIYRMQAKLSELPPEYRVLFSWFRNSSSSGSSEEDEQGGGTLQQ